ncbi:hypothetical protein, partial [Nocardia cyriacigeorgica]|uniref:hypothetical protein n=1 Tax=Nocardia cyriacigeorgica TaxID=135487 RepID=UPI001E60855D
RAFPDDIPVNHEAPKPGSGFFRDELESMLTYHTTCAPCPFKAELLRLLATPHRPRFRPRAVPTAGLTPHRVIRFVAPSTANHGVACR